MRASTEGKDERTQKTSVGPHHGPEVGNCSASKDEASQRSVLQSSMDESEIVCRTTSGSRLNSACGVSVISQGCSLVGDNSACKFVSPLLSRHVFLQYDCCFHYCAFICNRGPIRRCELLPWSRLGTFAKFVSYLWSHQGAIE